MNSKITTLPTTLIIIALLFLSRVAFSQNEYYKTHTHKNNNGVTNTELEYRGKIIFTDDEKDVKYISPGGFLKFSKRSFGTKRTIILEGESNNKIYREYREGSKKVAFDPDGKRWMGSVLPEIIRTTGIGAEERVKKFYAKGGINVLIQEISLLSSNYVKRKYYNAAFALPNLKGDEMAQLIKSSGEQINASYPLSQLLMENHRHYVGSQKSLQAAIHVAAGINSSYEQAKVYRHLLTKSNLADAQLGEIIKNVRNISSSYEKSKVLKTVLKNELSPTNLTLIISEVKFINSSYEQSRVLQSLIKNKGIEEINFEELLKTIAKVSSSYEQGKILNQLVTSKTLSKEQIIIVSNSSLFISSSFEQSKFLQGLINEQHLDEGGINAVLAVIDNIKSNYEQSKILQLLIAEPDFKNTNYLNAINQTTKVSSSYEQSKVLSQLIGLGTVPNMYQLALLKAIDEVSSSYEKSKLLQKIAPQLNNNKEVQDTFYKAAESLSNDEYGKVMRALRK